jgi:hypothetical protein
MKNLSTAMTEIVKGNSARYYSKYVVDGKEHTETLNNFKFQNMINPNNEITIGNTCSSSVTFSIYMPTVSLENKEITIFEGVKVGTEIKYIQLGIFTVTKQTSDGEYTSYEAYDRMYKADMPYFSDMAFPNTDKAILNEICGKLGISLATNIVTAHTISGKPQGYTYREIIGYMAMLQGCNAVINADGNLELRWYKDSGYVLDGHKYYQQGVTFTTSKDFIIEKLTCNNTKSGDKETSTITSGSGATGLSFANPFMTQTILDEVYKKIGGFTFRPLTVKFVGDYRLEVGDIITVNKGGVDYKVPIMQIIHECDGGLMDTVTSIGQSDTENTSVASGPITKQMERYYADLITVNKALINKLDVDTAKITYATITNLTAVKGDVDYLKVNNLTVDKANLLYASIERMEVVEGQIRNLNVDDLKAQVANINTLMFGSASGGSLTTEFSNSVVSLIGDAQIKSAMIESIAADKITSGKIYTNLVEILSESGNLDIADNTIQIKDDNKVTRVQIGKDANSDYNMYVWDKSGNLMFDALGLTENGVKREIIRNDMIKEDANIAANKLNIESLFNVINEDGSHTLKSSKIYVDANKQTLDVAFKDMTTNVTEIQKSVTTQGTQLIAVQEQISSKVWRQDITTAVNDLQIGGRNLFQNTGYTRGNLYLGWCQSTTTAHKDEIVADNATLSGKARKITYVEAGSQGAYIDIPASLKSKKNLQKKVYTQSCLLKANKAISVTWGNSSPGFNKSTVNVSTEWQKFEIKTTVVVNYVFSKLTEFFVSNVTAGTELYIADYKFEEGEFATPWTPAPEDTDSSISAVDTKVTTISNQYTSLNQSLTSLTATVNSNTTKISEKADGSTVTALQVNMTALTADLSGFKTTVSQTYTSKTEFNNLQIGGRNLLLNTADLTKWHKEASITVTKDSNDYFKISTTNTSSWWSAYWYISSDKSEQTYTLSGYNKKGTKTGHVVVRYYKSGANNILLQKDVSEGYFTIKFTVPSGAETITVYLGLSPTASGDYTYFKLPKLELGDKATDWSPAPEDTDEKFTEYSTTTQMNSAINQSANSVLTTVSSNYATKASLEVKIDKDKLISEINASADIIALKSNRFVLDSTNAKIAADGTVNFVQGTIGGWNISSTKLSGAAGLYGIAINKPSSTSTKVININHVDTTAAATYVDDFYVRADGYTYIPDGYLSTKNHSVGGKGIEIHEANIDFYDWTKKDNFIGTILAGVIGKDSSDARGAIAILCDDGDRVQIGRRRGVSASSYDSAITVNGNDELGIEFYGNVKGYGQKGACFYVNDAGLTNFAITNQENTIYGNCELSVYGTQRLKYELYVEGNIHGNVISTSDKNVKKDIKALNIEDSAHFIYSLIPSEFRFKNGTSNRLHHGLIAQEVKKSMGDSDWGLFIDKKVDNKNYIETEVNSETGEQTQLLTARYGLRYDELIADLIATVQSLNNRLKAVENN